MKHPEKSVKPSPPRRPPATTTTDGQPNTVSKTETGSGKMEYGSNNGRDLKIKPAHISERSDDFSSTRFTNAK